jgi:electron transfer flavoprotein alpha subunit
LRTLVVVETENGRVAEATLRVVTAATQRGLPVDLFIQDASALDEARGIAGIERIRVAAGSCPTELVPETLAAALSALAGEYSLIAAAHRTLARGALPRAAALANGVFLADITAVLGAQQFARGVYAGSLVSSVTSTGATTFATFRPSSFSPAGFGESFAEPIEQAALPVFSRTRLAQRSAAERSGQDLSAARVVVSGGRGLGSRDNMERLGRFAGRIDAALGASRAAVDAGYISNAAQIGQTGKIVAPDVYLALGISGAIQHLAGMKDSGLIVAVNKDADAPIFSVADVGLVADLFEVLNELEAHADTADAAEKASR